MTDPRSAVRAVAIYATIIPLAFILGYMLAVPMDYFSLATIGAVFLLLLLPLLLRWHYPMLLLSWNTVAVLPFLPGSPQVRLALTAASLLITWLVYALDRRIKPLNVRSITWPLVVLTLIVILTMQLTGGAGFRALGGQSGGAGRYVMLAGGILGFFAISARPIPASSANLYVGLYFLGGLTMALSSLATVLPRWMDYLYLLFPVEQTYFEEAPTVLSTTVSRLFGIASASMLAIFYMLARFGFRGMLNIQKPWRMAIFLGCCIGVLFGGYRSFLLLVLGVMGLQVYLEGFFKMKYLPVWSLIFALLISVLPIVDRLPYRVQRSLAFLPVQVSPAVAIDVQASTDWRIEIWKRVWTEIPNYWLLGKGYRLDPRALDMAQFRDYRGGEGEAAVIAGDYHNGPLSIIVPLGMPGVVAVVWFWITAWRFLLHNYRNGAPELKTVNTLLLAFFCVRVFHFVVIFGSFYSEFAHFTGLVGLSVALNGGWARAVTAPATVEETAPEPIRPLRARLQPVISSRS